METYIAARKYDMDSENTRDEFGLADPKIITLIRARFWEAQMAGEDDVATVATGSLSAGGKRWR